MYQFHSFYSTYEAWEHCNNLVHSWIMNWATPSIAQSIVHTDVAPKAWTTVKERFFCADLVRVSELQRKLYGFKEIIVQLAIISRRSVEFGKNWKWLVMYSMLLCSCVRLWRYGEFSKVQGRRLRVLIPN